MGLFLLILGIVLALNIFPVIAGIAGGGVDYFFDEFLMAWGIQLIVIVVIGFIFLTIWLIVTGIDIMSNPPEPSYY